MSGVRVQSEKENQREGGRERRRAPLAACDLVAWAGEPPVAGRGLPRASPASQRRRVPHLKGCAGRARPPPRWGRRAVQLRRPERVSRATQPRSFITAFPSFALMGFPRNTHAPKTTSFEYRFIDTRTASSRFLSAFF